MIYVTKYVLTEGIWVVPEEMTEDVDGYLYIDLGLGPRLQVRSTDWFRIREDAERRAAELVAAKVKSLKKSIQKFQTYKAPFKDLKPKK